MVQSSRRWLSPCTSVHVERRAESDAPCRMGVITVTDALASARRSRIYRGDSPVVVQSRGAAPALSSFRKASPAARCTASHGLLAQAARRHVTSASAQNRSGKGSRASPARCSAGAQGRIPRAPYRPRSLADPAPRVEPAMEQPKLRLVGSASEQRAVTSRAKRVRALPSRPRY